MLIDSHAHLYAKEFSNDLAKVIENAKSKNIEKVLLPNIDSNSIESMHKIVNEYPAFFYPMMGLHPCSVGENYEEELEIVKSHLDKYTYVAVGEIGIDLYWDKTYKKQQEKAFIKQVNWAIEKSLPIVIHSRESIPEILDILEGLSIDGLKGVFHCFTGTEKDVQRILDLDFYMGIGGIITFKNSNLAEVVKQIPKEKLLLETDAPYLAPDPHRGSRNESAYVSIIAEKIADVYDISLKEIEEITTENTEELFRAIK